MAGLLNFSPTVPAYVPRDDSVANGVANITSQSSPLMKQAAGAGMATANRRGLLNSGIAIGSAQNEVIKAATPIAAQDAAQAAQYNLSKQNFDQSSALQTDQMSGNVQIQTADLAAQQSRLEQQLGSAAALQAAQSAAEKERLGMTITAQEQQQIRDLNSAMDRLNVQNTSAQLMQGNEITSREGMQTQALGSQAALQAAQDVAAKERLGMQLDTQATMQGKELTSLETRAASEIAAQKAIAQLDADTKVGISNLDAATKTALNTQDNATKTAIANLDASVQTKNAAAVNALNASSIYASSYNAIMQNENIPADARAAALEHLYNTYSSNMGVVEQVFGTSLTWATPAASPAVTSTSTSANGVVTPTYASTDPTAGMTAKQKKKYLAANPAPATSVNYGLPSGSATGTTYLDGYGNITIPQF